MAKLSSVTRGAALKVIAIAVLIAVVAAGAPGSVGRALGQSGGGLEGDFTVTVAKEMIPKDVANGPLLIGRWRIAFNAGGAYDVERLDIGNVVRGTFKVDGDKVTLTDKSGPLSCANASASTGDQGDVSSGSYTWTLDAGHLTLAVNEDKCALRRILLSSAELTSFVACLTAGGGPATPAAATPEADTALTRLLTPPAPAAGATPETAAQGGVQAQIDGLLSQMSACWATGDPAKFLPLLSKGFETQFLGDTKQAQTSAIQGLAAAMASPILWGRAGELGTTTDAKTSAVVRQTVGTTSTFVRFNFVFEDGAWRWDGSQA